MTILHVYNHCSFSILLISVLLVRLIFGHNFMGVLSFFSYTDKLLVMVAQRNRFGTPSRYIKYYLYIIIGHMAHVCKKKCSDLQTRPKFKAYIIMLRYSQVQSFHNTLVFLITLNLDTILFVNITKVNAFSLETIFTITVVYA